MTVTTADKATSTTYAHNALGQRVSKTTDTRTTLFAYGQQGQLTGVYNADGTAQEELIYFKGVPVATLRGTERFYIHSDHLGTPRRITDSTKATVWSWDSDPFGLSAANEDPDSDGIDFIFNHRFAGQYYDSETGLHYNYFRDYDPATGRYVESDPIGLAGGLNTYGYVGGNPLSYSDPYGLYADTNGTYLKVVGNGVRFGLGPVSLGIGLGGLIADALMPGYTSVVDMPNIPAANDEQMCKKDNYDDGDVCKKKQIGLNATGAAIIMLAEAEHKMAYNIAVRKFNKKVAKHNIACPQHKVQPLQPWFE